MVTKILLTSLFSICMAFLNLSRHRQFSKYPLWIRLNDTGSPEYNELDTIEQCLVQIQLSIYLWL